MNLSGKSMNLLGDSITEGAGASSEENCYAALLQKSGIFSAVRNYGIGGTRIAPNTAVSEDPRWDLDFCGRAGTMEPADIIVVFGGTNDYGHGDAPFGSLTDTTTETFCGACSCLIEKLKASYPDAFLMLVTPLHRYGEDNPCGEGYKKPGKVLREYVDAMICLGRQHGVPILDLFNDPPFPASDQYLTDGLHPNDSGHALLAERILAYLQQV